VSVNNRTGRRPLMSTGGLELIPLGIAFDRLVANASNRELLLYNLIPVPSLNSNANSACLPGVIHLGELTLGALSEGVNTLLTITIPGSVLVKQEWGMLSGLARLPSRELSSDITESDFVFDVKNLLVNFTSAPALRSRACHIK